MKKIDPSLVVEIFGVVLVTVGIAAFSLPLAAIALGSFLVWATEKASK
jgi:UDP-N-acetylglucosamine:LPS N-acetylglucosamine transferase